MNLRERGCGVSRRGGVKGNCSGMYYIRKKLFSIKKNSRKGKGKNANIIGYYFSHNLNRKVRNCEWK